MSRMTATGIPALLEPIQKRAEAYKSHGTPGLHAPQDRARLLAAVKAVAELHKPERLDGRPIHGCRVCDWEQPGNEGWPCATVSAVAAALRDEA